jgi:raffinose/stachyose/melibiose transport system permease protein
LVSSSREARIGWALNMPAVILVVFFFLLPALIAVWFSLRSWDGVTASEFIGVSNFIELAGTERFWNSVRVNLALASLTLVSQIPLAFLLAVALHRRSGRWRLLRVTVFLPQLLSVGAAALLWLMVLHPNRGLLNAAFSAILNTDINVPWLGQTSTALVSVVVASDWYYFGLHTLIFLAGMSAIPEDFYDAIRLDSDRLRHELRYLTVPLLREQLLVSLILVISGSFGHILGFVSILTGGGPAGATELLGLYSIETAFRANRFGLASAITVVLLMIVVTILIVPVVRMTRRRVEYS